MHNFFAEGDTPAWFTLRFVDNPPRLVIGIQDSILERFLYSASRNMHIRFGNEYIRSFGVNSRFLRDTKKPWGFAGSIVTPEAPIDSYPNLFQEHIISLPEVVTSNKKGTKINWKALVPVAVTLSVLSLSFCDALTQEEVRGLPSCGAQLTTLFVHFGGGNLMIHGSLSSRFFSWLETVARSKMDVVRRAMVSAYFHMAPPRKEFGDHYIRAQMMEPGRFLLEVEDTSIWVAPKGDFGSGRTFSDTHTDTHIQQLTLLAGLAALCGEAQKDLR